MPIRVFQLKLAKKDRPTMKPGLSVAFPRNSPMHTGGGLSIRSGAAGFVGFLQGKHGRGVYESAAEVYTKAEVDKELKKLESTYSKFSKTVDARVTTSVQSIQAALRTLKKSILESKTFRKELTRSILESETFRAELKSEIVKDVLAELAATGRG